MTATTEAFLHLKQETARAHLPVEGEAAGTRGESAGKREAVLPSSRSSLLRGGRARGRRCPLGRAGEVAARWLTATGCASGASPAAAETGLRRSSGTPASAARSSAEGAGTAATRAASLERGAPAGARGGARGGVTAGAGRAAGLRPQDAPAAGRALRTDPRPQSAR